MTPWSTLLDHANRSDIDGLIAYARSLGPGESARAMAHLDSEERRLVLRALGPEETADLIEMLTRAQAVEVVEQLSPAYAADVLHELPTHTGTDIVRDLDDDDAAAVLAQLSPDEAEAVRRLSGYEDDTAGGLMVVEYAAVRASATVSQVVEQLRTQAARFRDFHVQYVYVVDEADRLTGVLRLRDLVLADGAETAAGLMIPDPISVDAATPLDGLQELFDGASHFGLPVTAGGRMVGVVRRATVEEEVGEEAHRDHLKHAGIVGGEELRSMPTLTRSRQRLQWLSINIVLNMLAASIIAIYQDTLTSVIALAVFLPIISDMSGCSGNQAVAVSMRELSIGVARPQDVLHVWGKELSVGILNGIALGVLLGGVAYLWEGNPWLGVVAGSALAINTVLAVSIGGTVPLLLKRLGVDPALASGPVLTTITDLCGFLLVLGIASQMLPLLV